MSDRIDFNELKQANALPSPKGVGLTVMRMCQRENVSLPELGQQIQGDPVLAGRIIKIANAINPVRTRPISAITTEALILVGVHTIRQVVLGISLVTANKGGVCKAFDYQQFWSRSLAMACAAQAITARIRIAPIAEMFTCGLLADIGRLGLATARPERYADLILAHEDQPPQAMIDAEMQVFGFNHLTLAAAMMSDWSIPRLFIEAVLHHGAPEQSGFDAESRQQRIILNIATASRIADICMATDEERERLMPALFERGELLGVEAATMAGVAFQASTDWVEWGQVLQLATRGLPPFPAQAPE